MELTWLIRKPSEMLVIFQDGMRVNNMALAGHTSYNYAGIVKDQLVKLELLKKDDDYGFYKITDKGKDIQRHLITIIQNVR